MTNKSSYSLWIGNIPFNVTEKELHDILSRVGEVNNVRIKYDVDKNVSKGFAFCEYKDLETCMLALKYVNGYELKGRKLKLYWATDEGKEKFTSGKMKGEKKLGKSGTNMMMEGDHMNKYNSLYYGTKKEIAEEEEQRVNHQNYQDSVFHEKGWGIKEKKERESGKEKKNEKLEKNCVPDLSEMYEKVSISNMIHTLTTSQIIHILSYFQKYSLENSSELKAFLQKNKHVSYALLHCLFLIDVIKDYELGGSLNLCTSELDHLNKKERLIQMNNSNLKVEMGFSETHNEVVYKSIPNYGENAVLYEKNPESSVFASSNSILTKKEVGMNYDKVKKRIKKEDKKYKIMKNIKKEEIEIGKGISGYIKKGYGIPSGSSSNIHTQNDSSSISLKNMGKNEYSSYNNLKNSRHYNEQDIGGDMINENEELYSTLYATNMNSGFCNNTNKSEIPHDAYYDISLVNPIITDIVENDQKIKSKSKSKMKSGGKRMMNNNGMISNIVNERDSMIGVMNNKESKSTYTNFIKDPFEINEQIPVQDIFTDDMNEICDMNIINESNTVTPINENYMNTGEHNNNNNNNDNNMETNGSNMYTSSSPNKNVMNNINYVHNDITLHPIYMNVALPDEALVTAVINNKDMLNNILKSKIEDMQNWNESQRSQVLSIQKALQLKGYKLQ